MPFPHFPTQPQLSHGDRRRTRDGGAERALLAGGLFIAAGALWTVLGVSSALGG